MVSIKVKSPEKKVTIELTESELRYILSCGDGLLLNIPKDALSTYVNFSVREIVQFSLRIRRIMDENDISV